MVARCRRRTLLSLALAALLVILATPALAQTGDDSTALVAGLTSTFSLTARAQLADEIAYVAPDGDLADDANRWKCLVDDTNAPVPGVGFTATPSLDGQALLFRYDGQVNGTHCYRTIATSQEGGAGPEAALHAQAFELELSFSHRETNFANCPYPSKLQALEFVVLRRRGNDVWQWAAQWQNVGRLVNGCSAEPKWRIWTAMGEGEPNADDDVLWMPVAGAGRLKANAFHRFVMRGEIDNDLNVRYHSLETPDGTVPLGRQYSFSRTRRGGEPFDQLDVAVQLTGNSRSGGAPYLTVVDGIRLRWYPTSPWED